MQSFVQNKKAPNLELKMLYFGIFKLEFEIALVVLHASTLLFSKIQIFVQHKKFSSLGQTALFAYFWAVILKNFCHIWNLHSKFVKMQSYVPRKILKFEIKKTFIWAFLDIWHQHPRICKMKSFVQSKKFSSLGPDCVFWIFLGCNIEKLLSYLKLATSNLSEMFLQTNKKRSSFLVNFSHQVSKKRRSPPNLQFPYVYIKNFLLT